MEYTKVLEVIAPCGLNCGECLAFENGGIRRSSLALAELLGPNFDGYAERFAEMNPTFKNYPAFKELLGFFSQGSCGGCREKGRLFQACGVHTCVKERGVDFCFECDEFPCERTQLSPAMYERWKNNNEVMKDLGVEGYYERIKDLPRYP